MAKHVVRFVVTTAIAMQLLSACTAQFRQSTEFPKTPDLATDDIRSDFDGWMRELYALHPDFLLRTDIERFEEERASVEQEITRPMSQLEVWRLFSRLNSTFNDAHNGILMPDQYEWAQAFLDSGGSVFPIEVHIDETRRLFAASAKGTENIFAAGDEITSINGIPARQIVDAMLARAHGDTRRFRRELVTRRFSLMYLLLFGSTNSYHIEGRAVDETKIFVTASGANKLPILLRPNIPAEQLFNYRILEGGVGYIRAGTFSHEYSQAFQIFTKEAFEKFRNEGIRYLIIDIRDNGGGDDPLWQEGLMENITTKPYRHVSRYSVRVTESNADPGDVIGDIQSGENNKFFTPAAVNPNRFRGSTYILLGPYTYSSAIQFAVAAQDYEIAKIAGEKTGGFSCQTGRVTTLPMGKTKLLAFAPILLFTRPSGSGCETGVVPDISLAIDPYDPDSIIEKLRVIAIATGS